MARKLPHPDPPTASERDFLRSSLLLRLQQHPNTAIREAAVAAHSHQPPQFLPHYRWFRSDWLGLLPDLPPIGCLALLDDLDPSCPNPWYYCTAPSCSTSALLFVNAAHSCSNNRAARPASPGPHSSTYTSSQLLSGTPLHSHSLSPGECKPWSQPSGALPYVWSDSDAHDYRRTPQHTSV